METFEVIYLPRFYDKAILKKVCHTIVDSFENSAISSPGTIAYNGRFKNIQIWNCSTTVDVDKLKTCGMMMMAIVTFSILLLTIVEICTNGRCILSLYITYTLLSQSFV
jgi:hypothetical protein